MLNQCIQLALKAGEAILKVYSADFDVDFKADQSPLTQADRLSNAIIVEGLTQISDYPIISEEEKEVPYELRKNSSTCWMVDPLDGTKEFVKRNGQFTVNIALILNGQPVLGVVYAPVTELLYFADAKGAFKTENTHPQQSIQSVMNHAVKLQNPGKKVKEKLIIAASQSHLSPETQSFIDSMKVIYPEVELISKGSSLKLCMVADGQAHVYPRFAPTMEWDTAAGDAICRRAGYQVNQYPEGYPLMYNKPNLLNPWFIVM